MDRPAVQMLWVEGRLTTLERLSVASFLECGHPVHLYTYGLEGEIPKGTQVLDANSILPRSECRRHGEVMGFGSWAPFSDRFRFELLARFGGIWCDADMVCLKPLDALLHQELFFATEYAQDAAAPGRLVASPTSGALRAPAGHPALEACRQRGPSVDQSRSAWGAVGPALVASVVHEFHLERHLLHPNAFCSVPHWEALALFQGPRMIAPDAVALHFWNEVLRWNFVDKDARYDPLSVYERLKARYAAFL